LGEEAWRFIHCQPERKDLGTLSLLVWEKRHGNLVTANLGEEKWKLAAYSKEEEAYEPCPSG
jgi:hypothetical protein